LDLIAHVRLDASELGIAREPTTGVTIIVAVRLVVARLTMLLARLIVAKLTILVALILLG
jgi:hypothetical protein